MITKLYLVNSDLQLPKAVSDSKIDVLIRKAEKDLRNLFLDDKNPELLFAALESEYRKDYSAWSNVQAYFLDDLVTHSENGILKAWKATTRNLEFEPSTESDKWQEVQLGTFLVGYVQPYLAQCVFLDYSVLGGVNVSHQGLQQVENETASPVGGNKLQAFLNWHKSERESYRSALLKYLDDQGYSLDSVVYLRIKAKKKRRRLAIRPVGYSGPIFKTNNIYRE